MASVGRRLGLPFAKGKSTKRKSFEAPDEELDHRSGGQLGIQGSSVKSTSAGNMSGDGSGDKDDIMALTNDVRNFSDALAKLKEVFSPEEDYVRSDEGMKITAHEKLGEILHILKNILQRYPMHSTDILTSAAVLISKVKGFNYESENQDQDDVLESLDQVALAFTSSVSDYLMYDIEVSKQNSSRNKSQENIALVQARNNSREPSQNPDEYRDSNLLSAEEMDSIMHQLDSGVEVALQRAKAWAKYAKDVTSYVEKRVQLEADYAKGLSKLANNYRPALTDDSFLPFQSVYCTALDQDVEYSQEAQTATMLIHTKAFIEPLNAKRSEHEKRRKAIKDSWQKELRRMQDAVNNMKKSRSLYVQRQQEYEKAHDAVQKAENEALGQSTGSSSVKLDKKKKLEEEAMHRAIEAETSYRTSVSDANQRQQELEKVKRKKLAELRELLFQCDCTMKMLTIEYFKLEQTLTASVPVQYQALCEASRQYEPGSQYAEYVKHLPMPQGPEPCLEPFVFEPYTPDHKYPEDPRKPNSYSSGSSSDLHHFMQEHQGRSWSPKNQRHRANSDSDSISGSSSRSQGSSPSASPYTQNRKAFLSGSDLTEADRDSHLDGRLEGDGLVSDGVQWRGNLSKAALTHSFKRIHMPARCKECENYVYLQGIECDRCGVVSHKKCLETLRWECGYASTKVKISKTTFGVDLREHLTMTQTDVPHIIKKCIMEIDHRGLQTKGIYRVSGVKSKVDALCQWFEKDQALVDLTDQQPHVIANVLKLYLRELPEPLLTFPLYDECMKLAREENAVSGSLGDAKMVESLKSIISQLPKANLRTCAMLMYHLCRVTEEEEANQMTATNLGIVFGPTLLRTSDKQASLTTSLMDTPHQTRIVELLILHVEDIFGGMDGCEIGRMTAIEEVLDSSGADDLAEKRASYSKWDGPPQITKNLLDELAQEEPRFQKVTQESDSLRGSAPSSPQGQTSTAAPFGKEPLVETANAQSQSQAPPLADTSQRPGGLGKTSGK